MDGNQLQAYQTWYSKPPYCTFLFRAILVFTLWFQLTLLLNTWVNLAQDQSIHLLFQRQIITE